MDRTKIEAEKQAIVERYGPWTAHNIELAEGLYTIERAADCAQHPVQRVAQVVSDLTRKPLDELRVLDLGCLEGIYGIEFARHGADVVAIEGRTQNIVKARFAKNALGLDNIQLVQADVRELSRARYGAFDVVLCLGLLYHLDSPDVFAFLERVGEVCDEIALIDTHVSLSGREDRRYKGNMYFGHSFVEHRTRADRIERLSSLWASLDNPTSFWLTRTSLVNAIAELGRFSSVLECHAPPVIQPRDRLALAAVERQRVGLLSVALVDDTWKRLPEPDDGRLPLHQRRGYNYAKRVALALPAPVTRFARRLNVRLVR